MVEKLILGKIKGNWLQDSRITIPIQPIKKHTSLNLFWIILTITLTFKINNKTILSTSNRWRKL